MTKESLNASPITQRAIFILGGKVSKNSLTSSQPLAEQLTFESRECYVAYFIKYEMSSIVRDYIITLRKKKVNCQYGLANSTDPSSIPRT